MGVRTVVWHRLDGRGWRRRVLIQFSFACRGWQRDAHNPPHRP